VRESGIVCGAPTGARTLAATGARIAVLGVHHWAWAGVYLYIYPDGHTLSEVQAAFPNPSDVTVSQADYGRPPAQNRALSYVFGVNKERNEPGNNGLKYINLNAGPRMRYGTGGSLRRDYTVWTINPYVNIETGDTFAVRHYLITDQYEGVNARAADWVSEVEMVQRTEGKTTGRQVALYSEDNATFGAAINGSACTVAAAAAVCTGDTTPQAESKPLFAITCGSQRYVGHDLYYFAPSRASEAEPIRSYVCSDEPAGTRPNITLLGWFAVGGCAPLQAASYLEDYCTAAAPTPTPTPTSSTTTMVPTTSPVPSIMCEGNTSLFQVKDIDLCVPNELYPAENVSKCLFDKTWEEVGELKGVMETGGLGNLMKEYEWEAWVCGAQLPCALQAQDWVCYTYNEKYEVFVPWGYNLELGLVKKWWGRAEDPRGRVDRRRMRGRKKVTQGKK